MTHAAAIKNILVLGVGNTLMQDDGIGIHVTEALRKSTVPLPHLDFIDGGTIGLSLLPRIEEAHALIIVDAAEINAPPGTVRVFRGTEIERQMSGRKKTVHEVAIADLLSTAALLKTCPLERALVAIQPASTAWGLEPTDVVRAAIPGACATIRELTREYQDET